MKPTELIQVSRFSRLLMSFRQLTGLGRSLLRASVWILWHGRLCRSNHDAILMTGNVAAFLSSEELESVMCSVALLLNDGGILVIGTTTASRGGPRDQDRIAESVDLKLLHRYSDWHLTPWSRNSPWTVCNAWGRRSTRLW